MRMQLEGKSQLSSGSPLGTLRAIFLVALGLAVGYSVVFSLHWPMLVNAPVMHYVNFLMGHGMQPYRDITDMNMPGAYLVERTGMLLFGGGDLGWRLYDFFLAAVLMASMTVIAKPYDWLAGVFAGGLFALRHISEGPWFSGEREQEMAVLLVASCALLFLGVRRRTPSFLLGFGFLAGMAASIKPTLAPFGLLSLVLLYLALRRRALAPAPYLLCGLAGLCLALLVSLGFLLVHHAFSGFGFVLRSVMPVYASLNDPGRRSLLKYALPWEWLYLLPLALVCLALRRSWTWEKGVILLGAGCGLFSYLLQGKGFWYQRYIFTSFALLLLALEILPKGRPVLVRWAAMLALVWATIYVIPRTVRDLRQDPGPSAFTQAMERDLEALGGSHLQRDVQCFDMTFGCLNSLYHLGLVENTGFTGDMLLFPQNPNPVTEHYRTMFWQAQAEHPATVMVVTNQEFGAQNSFSRFDRWPELQTYLAEHYRLAVTRSFPREDKYKGQAPAPPATTPTYRIYVRDSSAAQHHEMDRSAPAARSGEAER